jgi:hypothetical protein
MDKRIFMIAALAMATVACGDDDSGGDDDVVIRSDSSVPNPTIDGGLDSGTTSDGGNTSDGSTPKGAPGCFSGTPTTSVQFLNACADGYREFDNAARLPGYVKGKPLPQL